jgi:signal transduction histidine kinase
VSVDPARVEQMVDSLLVNARERTTRGQTIRIHVGATDDGGALISIDDDGRGTPELGAELSLAIRLAEAHGGRLWLEPLAKGASYRLELRAAGATAKEASA